MDEKEKQLLQRILKKIVENLKVLDEEKGTYKATPFLFFPQSHVPRLYNLYEKLQGGLL